MSAWKGITYLALLTPSTGSQLSPSRSQSCSESFIVGVAVGPLAPIASIMARGALRSDLVAFDLMRMLVRGARCPGYDAPFQRGKLCTLSLNAFLLQTEPGSTLEGCLSSIQWEVRALRREWDYVAKA